MIKSLYTGVTGMRSFQTKMDVIANNIANVNTTSFKSGRSNFQDMLSQTMSDASAPVDNGLGGVNPRQVGLGVKVSGIDTIMTEGSLQSTNRELDFAIEGEGFFVVSEDGGTTKSYTRDGTFYKDADGNLVTGGGLKVLGYENATAVASETLTALKIPEENGGRDLQSFTVDQTGTIKGVYSNATSTETVELGQLAIAKFNNPSGLKKTSGNNYAVTDNSGIVTNGVAGGAGYGLIRQNYLEMSNVDLANEFTEMIITNRAYQANSRIITTSDEMLQELINLKR